MDRQQMCRAGDLIIDDWYSPKRSHMLVLHAFIDENDREVLDVISETGQLRTLVCRHACLGLLGQSIISSVSDMEDDAEASSGR